MAAYRRVYDSRHLQADCQEHGIISETSVIEYGLPLPCFYFIDHSAGVERKLTSDNRLPLIIVMVRRRTMAARQFPILALYSTH